MTSTITIKVIKEMVSENRLEKARNKLRNGYNLELVLFPLSSPLPPSPSLPTAPLCL